MSTLSIVSTSHHFRQITPDPSTPAGYCLRSAFSDMIDIFEVNRKECARLLLEMPKWFASGTFKPKPGTVPQTDVDPKPDMGWQLESTVIEVSQSDDSNRTITDSQMGIQRQYCPPCWSFPILSINPFIIFL